MPKRVIDGEALWQSSKLRKVPAHYRVHLAWLLPLALANGSFECSPELIWSQCYSFMCPDFTRDDVSKMLDALEEAKVLFRWPVNGKIWGVFTGYDKPGRLPQGTAYVNAKKGEAIPKAKLDAFLGVKVARRRNKAMKPFPKNQAPKPYRDDDAPF